MSAKRWKYFYLICFAVVVVTVIIHRITTIPGTRSLLFSMLGKVSPEKNVYVAKNYKIFYNRYCTDIVPRNSTYGYTSVIRQMQWITNTRDTLTIFLTTNSESHVPWVTGVFVANEQPEHIMPPHEKMHMLDSNNTRWLPVHQAQRRKKAVALISNSVPRKKGRTILLNLQLTLTFGMLPVVMGTPREDYCAIALPNSFIHVDDFSSLAQLEEYLNWLDQNDTAYASYFAWRAYGKIVVGHDTRTECRLCGFLHQNLNELHSFPRNRFDYFANVDRQCTVFK